MVNYVYVVYINGIRDIMYTISVKLFTFWNEHRIQHMI